ncbi:hypothetical protein [Streptomyces griseoluteus]|uniref:hypothetical protein n=1 Tax=Streptomyces griseoluteus TaxID=29306 RepID=UPI0036C9EFB1
MPPGRSATRDRARAYPPPGTTGLRAALETENLQLHRLAHPTTPRLRLGRLTGGTYEVPEHVLALPGTIISTDIKDVLTCDVIIATAMKWAYVDSPHWQWAIIDEAYQMRSDALLLIAKLFDRALLVGDPGQLDPFSIISTPGGPACPTTHSTMPSPF